MCEIQGWMEHHKRICDFVHCFLVFAGSSMAVLRTCSLCLETQKRDKDWSSGVKYFSNIIHRARKANVSKQNLDQEFSTSN